MAFAEQLYLAIVVGAFVTFAVALAAASIYTGKR